MCVWIKRSMFVCCWEWAVLFIPNDFGRLENWNGPRRRTIPLAEIKEFTPHLGGDSRNDI